MSVHNNPHLRYVGSQQTEVTTRGFPFFKRVVKQIDIYQYQFIPLEAVKYSLVDYQVHRRTEDNHLWKFSSISAVKDVVSDLGKTVGTMKNTVVSGFWMPDQFELGSYDYYLMVSPGLMTDILIPVSAADIAASYLRQLRRLAPATLRIRYGKPSLGVAASRLGQRERFESLFGDTGTAQSSAGYKANIATQPFNYEYQEVKKFNE